jgi:hypothetical protein
VLTVLRVFGIGTVPAVILLPLTLLMFLGPLSELTVALLLAKVERRTAWLLLGFLPSFALSIGTTTKAYFDGMLGRPYTWVKTQRTGAVTTETGVPEPATGGSAPPGPPVAPKLPEPAAPLAMTGLVMRSGTGGLPVTGTRTFADRRDPSGRDRRVRSRS